MNTEHKRNLQRAADFCREMKHDALAEACSRASAHIVELERAEAERDALRALLRECHDRFVDAYGPDGRFTRKIGAAIDAARKEGEG